jgi:hypothetical protein
MTQYMFHTTLCPRQRRTRTSARRPRESRIANISWWARCAVFTRVSNGAPLNVDGPGIPRLVGAFIEHRYNIILVEISMLLCRDGWDVRSSNSDDAILQQAAHDAHLFEESWYCVHFFTPIHAHFKLVTTDFEVSMPSLTPPPSLKLFVCPITRIDHLPLQPHAYSHSW